MKFSQQIEEYKRKIQKFANPNYPTQIITEPSVIFAALLQDYLKEFQLQENFFAYRVLHQLNKENDYLLAELNQYCALNHVANTAAQKSFHALIIAYFYYYADYYPLTGNEIAVAYPALQQYIIAPLKLYKKSEQKRVVLQMISALDSNQSTASKSAADYLRQHPIPTEMVPQFISEINNYLSKNALNFEYIYPLLFNYATDDTDHLHPLSLRFNLVPSQRCALATSLLPHLGTHTKSSRLQALFLLVPEAEWPALIKSLMSQYSLSILNSIPLSHPQLANNENLVDTVVQSLLVTMSSENEHVTACACRALLTINVPHCYHAEAVSKMVPIFGRSLSGIQNEMRDGLAKFITSDDTKQLIKPVLITGIMAGRWDLIPILKSLAPQFASDPDFIHMVSHYVTGQFLYGLGLLEVFPLPDNILCASLYNTFLNINYMYAIDSGYFINNNIRSLHGICKTKKHFKVLIDAFVREFTSK